MKQYGWTKFFLEILGQSSCLRTAIIMVEVGIIFVLLDRITFFSNQFPSIADLWVYAKWLLLLVGWIQLSVKSIVRIASLPSFNWEGEAVFYLLSGDCSELSSMVDLLERAHHTIFANPSAAFSSFTWKRSWGWRRKCCLPASLLRVGWMLQERPV